MIAALGHCHLFERCTVTECLRADIGEKSRELYRCDICAPAESAFFDAVRELGQDNIGLRAVGLVAHYVNVWICVRVLFCNKSGLHSDSSLKV